jgi:probable addiction module antidote protein
MIKPRARDFKADLLEELKNPKFAEKYLNAVFEDGSKEEILLALRDVCDAQGMTNLARKTKINRKSLYVALSPKGNPTLATLQALLAQSGLRLAVHTSKPTATSRAGGHIST